MKIRKVSDGIIASLSDACEMLSRGADTDEIQALLAAQIAEVRALAQIGE